MFFVGLFIHLIFLFSIFDIYFKSPIVKDVVPYQPKHEAVADRLVLFIVDGLRAESFVNYTTMPYMRSVANSIGRWGISNTQVPTESRPGHVAVIAGFYEDPSAVAKGWKENPVDFDSVFNQTKHTWCWGAYDIVNIFTKGHDDHITGNVFDPYDSSFSTSQNTTLLDAWVFHSVSDLFLSAKKNEEEADKLSKKKIIFFLHLLGTDTSGHTHKPKTPNFLTQLRYVDEGIKEVEKVIREYYGDDGKTTFLMTSDHGMTDWGSHGSGDDHETQTPYVVWGAGINTIYNGGTSDPATLSMSLDHRLDLNQADLAPLMSTILSIPVPVNSIGEVRIELLNMTLSNKALAVYSNSRQLAAQYNKKRLDIETDAISYIYQPYNPLTRDKYDEIISFTEKLVLEENFEQLILFSEEIIRLSLAGLRYYHNYYQGPLLILVTLSFMGWIAYLLKIVLTQKINVDPGSPNFKRTLRFYGVPVTELLNIIFSILCFTSFCIVCVQNLPMQYYVYFLMPILLWWYALSPLHVWIKAIRKLKENKSTYTLFVEIISYIVGSFAMGLSFTYRWMLSIPLLGMAVWPFMSSSGKHLNKKLLPAWSCGCLALSIFSFMPVVGKNVYIELVVIAGLFWLAMIAIYTKSVLLNKRKDKDEYRREIILNIIQMVLLIISLQNIYVQSKRFDNGTPVSTWYQIIAWFIAVLCFIIPVTFSRRLICRLFALNTSILNFYLLLSVSHEGLFMVALILNIMSWIYIEFKLLRLKNVKIIECSFESEQDDKKGGFPVIERSINNEDFRRAFFFVSFLNLQVITIK
ncbi:hypothetical protein O3G_MSEX001317 [Manduca sexta]|uniref:GPI ethanolamine phosphate transferase 1 n=1 Tax=Manduca sexta TaxID=7130 RepID=A0A921YJN2_MANSE|nr:hypothetical protein O3G_MSEX001317 [Manduca sexta]